MTMSDYISLRRNIYGEDHATLFIYRSWEWLITMIRNRAEKSSNWQFDHGLFFFLLLHFSSDLILVWIGLHEWQRSDLLLLRCQLDRIGRMSVGLVARDKRHSIFKNHYRLWPNKWEERGIRLRPIENSSWVRGEAAFWTEWQNDGCIRSTLKVGSGQRSRMELC